jgi:DNA polymerase III delta prime subunit
MPGHLFISYARKDGAVNAERIDRTLADAGFTTWRDTRGIDPTVDFTAEIEKAIESATYVIACITPDVKRDDSFVRRELGYALAVKIPIVTARFADVVPPISIVNNTYFDFMDAWDGPFERLRTYVSQDPRTRTAAASPEHGDEFRPYVEMLYKQIVSFLDKTVFRSDGAQAGAVIPLHAQEAANAVPSKTASSALPRAFFDLAGVDELNTTPASVFSTLGEAFERYERRLLLLGAPGSGKTTAAMAFARDAVARRLHDPSSPLPIVLPIAAWDAERRRPEIKAWIAEVVPLLADRVSDVLSHREALLVLDGLDELGDRLKDPPAGEMDPDPRSLFLRIVPDGHQVLLTSRLAEYSELRRKAPLNGAVTLRPLDDDQIDAYLAPAGELRAVADALPDLRDALRIPLLLSLFAVAFSNRDLPGIADLSVGAVRDAIFELFIRRRYEHEARKPNSSLPFTLDQVYSHLGSMVARVEPYLQGGGWWDVPTLLTTDHIRESVGEGNGDALAEVLVRLNLLVPTDGTHLRFLHLLLRDHLAFRQALKLANSSRAVERVAAMIMLRELHDRRSLSTLAQATKDTRRQVRWNATAALAQLHDVATIPVLISMLSDSSQPTLADAYDQTPMARSIAADAIVALGAPAVPALIAALDHESAQVRGAAADCLGRIGNADALPTLERHVARVSESEMTDIGWDTERLSTVIARAIERIKVASVPGGQKVDAQIT